jgi:hypothetical protein
MSLLMCGGPCAARPAPCSLAHDNALEALPESLAALTGLASL